MKPSHWNSVTWRLKLHWLWMVPMTWLVFEHFHDSTIQLLLLRRRRLLSTFKEAASRKIMVGLFQIHKWMQLTVSSTTWPKRENSFGTWKWTSNIPVMKQEKMDWENAHQNIILRWDPKTNYNSETTFALINVTFEPRNESCKTHVAYKWVDLMCNLLVSSLLIKSVFLACLPHDDESHSMNYTVDKYDWLSGVNRYVHTLPIHSSKRTSYSCSLSAENFLFQEARICLEKDLKQ